METEAKDLQTWARENKVWKKESWRPFLEDLERLHLMLTKFLEFHRWLRGTFNNKRISLLPERLKNSARLIVAGGGKEENAFARMMFDLFNVKVAGANSYEESVDNYERQGDGVRILVGSQVLGINENELEHALQKLEEVVSHFKQQLGVSKDSEAPEENFTGWINPENPELVGKLNEFLNLAANMLEPANPYVLLIRYLSVASLGIVIDFLGCGVEGVKSLAELLEAYIYDNNLDTRSVEEINAETVNDLFWLLSSYDSSVSSISSQILYLFGEDGVMHRIVKTMYPEIDEKFEELWEQRFNSLLDLRKSGKWILPRELGIFIGKGSHVVIGQRVIERICAKDHYAILLVKPRDSSSAEIDVEDLSLRYSYNPRRTNKTEYPIIIALEYLFPLFATGYLQVKVSDKSDVRGFRDCKFLAVRPKRCQGKYKKGKDSYLKLIKALGELSHENKAND